eukprot:7224799-Pyramimonas_sp.AAC.3
MHTIQPYINPRKHVYSIIIGRVTVIEWPLRGRAEPYTTCAETCAPSIHPRLMLIASRMLLMQSVEC